MGFDPHPLFQVRWLPHLQSIGLHCPLDRHVLSVLPSNTLRITHLGLFPGIQRTPSSESDDSGSGAASSMGNGNGNGSSNGNDNNNASTNGNGSIAPKKKKNKLKGWAGEVEDADIDQEEVPFLCDGWFLHFFFRSLFIETGRPVILVTSSACDGAQ